MSTGCWKAVHLPGLGFSGTGLLACLVFGVAIAEGGGASLRPKSRAGLRDLPDRQRGFELAFQAAARAQNDSQTNAGLSAGGRAAAGGDIMARGGRVQVVGSHAYVAAGPAGLKVFDISDRRRPKLAVSDAGGIYTWAVQVKGTHAFVGASREGLLVYDVSQPGGLLRVAACPTSGGFGTRGLHVVGDYAYVADESSGHVVVFDVRNPLAPSRTHSFALAGARLCQRAGEFLYIVSEEKLCILDIGDWARTRTVGEMELNGMVHDLQVLDGYAYLVGVVPNLARPGADSLLIVDARDPARPQRVGGFGVEGVAAGQGLHVVGAHAWLADAVQGLQVLDVSQPAHPALVSSLLIPQANGVQVVGRHAYVSAVDLSLNNASLDVVDVGAPGRLLRLGGGGEPGVVARHRWVAAKNSALLAGCFLGAVLGTMVISSVPAALMLSAHRWALKGGRVRHPYLECLALNVLLALGVVILVYRRTLGGNYVEIETGLVFSAASAVVLVGFPLGGLLAARFCQRLSSRRG